MSRPTHRAVVFTTAASGTPFSKLGFGKPLAFQSPRSLRVGVRVTW